MASHVDVCMNDAWDGDAPFSSLAPWVPGSPSLVPSYHLRRPEIPITPGSVSHVYFCIASRLWSSTRFSLLHSIDGGIEQWEVVGSRCSIRDGLRDASSDRCFVQRHRGRAWMLFAVGLWLELGEERTFSKPS